MATTIIRTLQYSMPLQLHQHVQMIQPTIRFSRMRTYYSSHFDLGPVSSRAATRDYLQYNSANREFNATFCNTTITPTCLRQLYNVGNFQADSRNGRSADAFCLEFLMFKGNRLGVCGYLKQYAKYSDLAQFLDIFAPDENPMKNNFTYALINGGLDVQDDTTDDDVEANCRDTKQEIIEVLSTETLFSRYLIRFNTLLPSAYHVLFHWWDW